MNKKVTRKTYLAILAAALLSFTGILNETSMNVTYPQLSKDLQTPLATIQWITTGYLLMVTIVMATTAYLLKRFDAKKIYIFAASAFFIGIILCATAVNFPMLLIGRLIQAMATGLSTPIMYQIIFTKIPRNKIATMTGVASMVISLAPAIGPTYGGIIASFASWRLIFWLLLPLIIISFCLGYFNIDLEATGTRQKIDLTSLIFLAITLTSIVFAISQVNLRGFNNPNFYVPIIIAVIAFAIFVWTDLHGKNQLLEIRIFKQSDIRLSAFNYFSLQCVNIGISFLLPVYSQYVLKISPFTAGLMLLPGSIVGAIVSPLSGKFADNHGYAKPIITGNIIMTCSLLLFFFMQHQLSAFWIMVLYSVLRLGFNLAFSNTISDASNLVPDNNKSDVNSIFNMLQQYAGSIGVGSLAAMLAYYQNNGFGTFIKKTFAGGHLAFICLTILAILATIASIVNFHRQKLN